MQRPLVTFYSAHQRQATQTKLDLWVEARLTHTVSSSWLFVHDPFLTMSQSRVLGQKQMATVGPQEGWELPGPSSDCGLGYRLRKRGVQP